MAVTMVPSSSAAAGSTFTVKNVQAVMRGLDRARYLMREAVAMGLNEVGEETILDSKAHTPVSPGGGVLRNSGTVMRYAQASDLRVWLTYGTEYAIYVHEIPPPPKKSPGGRSARHKIGEWKFLENAVNRTARSLVQRVAQKARAILGS